jgi:hypothetical protein
MSGNPGPGTTLRKLANVATACHRYRHSREKRAGFEAKAFDRHANRPHPGRFRLRLGLCLPFSEYLAVIIDHLDGGFFQ